MFGCFDWEKSNLILQDKKTYKTPCLPTKKKKEKAYKSGDVVLMEDFLKTLNSLGYKKTEEKRIGNVFLWGRCRE